MMVLQVALRLLGWVLVLWREMRGEERSPANDFVMLWLCLVVFTALVFGMSLAGALWCVPLFVLGLILLMPWTFSRHVLIPLGMSRTARFLSSLAGWTWGSDRKGGGLVAGAWAILRQPVPNRDRMAEIEAARDAEEHLTAAQVLATGLLAAARDDLESARALVESVDAIGRNTTPTMVHKLAREWLVADAAERGDWARVALLARSTTHRTRMTRLLCAVGARLARGADAPSSAFLWALWLIAPMRRRTYAWVRRAQVLPREPGHAPLPMDRRLGTTLLPDHHADALSAHAFALEQEPSSLTAEVIENLARVWDQALTSPATRRAIMQRAAALGVRSADRALKVLGDDVARDIAGMARAAQAPIAERRSDSFILGEAQRWLRNELMSEIELAFDALDARAAQKRALSPMDEWRDWLSLRGLYERAARLGGLELRRLAFPHIHHIVCKLGVWLWNERREHLMANAMFRWLLDEALAVGDAEAIELQSRNFDNKL